MYGGGLVMVVLLVLSMSVRHSVLCESGSRRPEESDAGLQLARQSLEARLLNIEQEAMENTLLIEKVLRRLRDKYAKSSEEQQLTFADLYKDAKKLFVDIDAAFDRMDDDIFSKHKRPQVFDDTLNVVADVESMEQQVQRDDDKDDDKDDDDRRPRRDNMRKGEKIFDPFAADDDKRSNNPENRCGDLAETYSILPQISWGTAPNDIQLEWRALDCDSIL